MKLLFVGDIMLGRIVNDILNTKPPEYVWGDTLPVFRDADVKICNLECVISDRGTPWTDTPKAFHFRTDSKNVECLNEVGIDAVSCANNHALDYGYDALSDMIKILDKEEICHSGAGNDFEAAQKPAIFEIQGQRIGLISFTDNEPQWEATKDKGGVYFVPVDSDDDRAKHLFDLVRQTKQQVDRLIVSAHWGPNWGHTPQPNHPPFARALIDAGADIIFGHSCHVFQGIEFYKDHPILYSTGDFIDDYAIDERERNDESFIFVIETDRDKIIGLHLYPTIIDNFQAVMADKKRAEEIANKMVKLCEGFGTKAVWEPKQGYVSII